jgi:hypothetical protein
LAGGTSGRGRARGKEEGDGGGGWMWLKYIMCTHENSIIKSSKIYKKRLDGRREENNGVNMFKLYYMHVWKIIIKVFSAINTHKNIHMKKSEWK